MKTTVIFLVLGVLLMLSLNPQVEASWANCHTNGCSIPFNYFYKSQFTPACQKHDVCYACGVRHGWTRYQCDVAFRRDMRKWCSFYGWLQRSICNAHAQDYYTAVRAIGWKFYESPSLGWCKSCLKSNGDPNKVLMFGRK